MKIQRLRVAELRQFRQPFELADIQPGLNIFSGANEAGKSTLVRAIRAAFFERHRSTSVDDLRPYGDASAAPLVEVDFRLADTDCRLSKSFLQRKRCELTLQAGGSLRRLEGVEAEDYLAERLGFQFSGKGANRDEFLGIPGLLWIEQGAAQELRGAVTHAADHLRKALDQGLGDVAASGGDEVVAQVRRLRDELLTGSGKPRAEYQKAIEQAASVDQRLAELQRDIASYRDQVDQLRLLRDAHAADAQAQPWQALRQQQGAAQQALQATDALGSDLQREREKLRQARGLCDLLLQRLADADQQQQALATRDAALATATTRHEEALAAEARGLQAQTAASTALAAARDGLALARQEDTRATLQRQAADATARAGELGTQFGHAAAEHERAQALRRDAAQLQIAAADLDTLRRTQTRLTALDIEQQAIATRVAFELDPGVTLQLGSNGGGAQPVAGRVEHLLSAAATLAIDGVGRIRITPGGRDLAALVQEQATLQGQQQALLQRLGLASLAEAEARHQTHAQRLSDAGAADKACKLLAPKGLDALRNDLDALSARQAEATAALARLPDAQGQPVPALAAAERQHQANQSQAEVATQHLQAARQALATAASQRAAAQQERDALKTLLDDTQRQADLARQRSELVQAQAHESTAQASAEAIERRLAEARPDILKQDLERFRRSADEAERAHQSRDRQIAQLEATLATAGAQGLEEELARQQSEQALALRRRDELRRRAEAAELLLQRLQARRQALTQRLQAPLQRHLDRYLQLLFPSARLEVDEALVPGALTRSGPRGLESGDFDSLSFGAREQMGVISRLAYADLLQEGGRPTLVILDDALVHSDEQRLAQMKRVLFDAAQRHQVLLFTCHPAAWRDMGVPLRLLEGPR